MLPKYNTAEQGSARSIVLNEFRLGQIPCSCVAESPHDGVRDVSQFCDGLVEIPNVLSVAPGWSYP
ncbi:hypothetical protein Pan258_20110 [Symmachiella dynata]|nr:hypothetical protein Pan258_20110 [Symmachiella dynata]